MTEQNRNEAEDIQASPRLVEALNQLQRQRVFVPPAIDETVMRQAHAHLQTFERPQSAWRTPVSWAAMAACLALALWLAERFNKPGAPFAREDINHDGRVDILDAFALARRIETGKTLDPGWDINRDGRIDRADVNAVAARAVSLTQVRPTKRARNSIQGNSPPPQSHHALVAIGTKLLSGSKTSHQPSPSPLPSPPVGERVAGGPVRGWFIVPRRNTGIVKPSRETGIGLPFAFPARKLENRL